jgi:hypothetical protein
MKVATNMESDELQALKNEAYQALDKAVTAIYNVPGDRWQMAYEMLEAILFNLKIETKDVE